MFIEKDGQLLSKHRKLVSIYHECMVWSHGDASILAGPIYDSEAILYADIDLEQTIEDKQTLDMVGYYARPEAFTLRVNRRGMTTAAFYEGPEDTDQDG